MLPQLTKTQAFVDELTHEAMFDAVYQAGPLLLEISSYQQHEGQKGSFQMATGEIESIEFKKDSVEVSSKIKPGRGEKLDDILALMAKAGAELGTKMQNGMLATVEAATEKVGNVVKIKDGVITPEAFFEMMEKVEIDFDEQGQSQSSWFLAPEAAAKLQQNYQGWQKNPELRAKLEQLERKKKDQFRAREATRRLAR